MVNAVLPSLKEKKQMTRYRDGKVVTTTGAKVFFSGGFKSMTTTIAAS